MNVLGSELELNQTWAAAVVLLDVMSLLLVLQSRSVTATPCCERGSGVFGSAVKQCVPEAAVEPPGWSIHTSLDGATWLLYITIDTASGGGGGGGAGGPPAVHRATTDVGFISPAVRIEPA